MSQATQPVSAAGGPDRRRWAVMFIFITVLLDIMALGLVAPILPGPQHSSAILMGLHGLLYYCR